MRHPVSEPLKTADCENHSAYYVAALSTADRAPAPRVYCANCNREVPRSLVEVNKGDGVIVIHNPQWRWITFVSLYTSADIPPGARAVYAGGQFFRTRLAAMLSMSQLSQGENGQHRLS